MPRITKLQKEYIQKSRIFLYPLLGIRRGISITPVQTYMSWENTYQLEDCKLICVYHMRSDKEFKQFEEKVLLQNTYFHDCFELDDGKVAYVFDFKESVDHYLKVTTGQYSKIKNKYQDVILRFFKTHHKHHDLILSYLQPTLFYKDYANLLMIKVSILKKVGQLCSLPNLSEEELKVKKKSINFEEIKNSFKPTEN